MTIPYGVGLPVTVGGRYSATGARGRGSGRYSDWVFPDPFQINTTAAIPNVMRNRLNGSTLASTVGAYGGGITNIQMANGSGGGVPGIFFQGNGAGQGQLFRPSSTGNGPSVWLNINKAKAGHPAGYNDYNVTCVVCRASYTNIVGGVLDSGLQVTIDGGRFVADAKPGFAFMRRSANLISFAVQPTNISGITHFNVTNAATFDETIQHDYAMVFESAAFGAEARVTAYVDWVPVKTLQWGAGITGVTMPDLSSVTLPMVPQIIFGLNGQYIVPAAGFRVSSGATVFDAIF